MMIDVENNRKGLFCQQFPEIDQITKITVAGFCTNKKYFVKNKSPQNRKKLFFLTSDMITLA